MARESKKIDKVRETMVSFVIPKCSAISGRAGAIIELARGETKV